MATVYNANQINRLTINASETITSVIDVWETKIKPSISFSHLSPIRSSTSRVLVVVVATIIAGFSETVGIGLLLPVLNMFQNPELALIYSEKLENFIGIEVNLTDVTRFIFAGLIAFFLISGGFQFVTDILIARLVEDLKSIWQKRILDIYFAEDYAFHINSMKGQLIQKQMVHTDRAGEVVLQLCNLARDIFLAIFISSMLIILSWSIMAVLVLTVGPVLYLTSIYSRKIINRKAEEAQHYEAKAFSMASEAMDGIKEIWAFGMQSSMSKRFSQFINEKRIRQTFIRSVFNVPSVVLKTTTLVALAVVLYYFVVSERSDLIGLLGVFGVGLFRVNGAAGRINNTIVSISGAWPSLRIVSEELNRSSHASTRLDRELMLKEKISFNDVSFSFKNERLFGIKNISLTIKRGSIVGIVGPSGSGKTTLLGLLLGFLDPGGGEVFIDDKNLQLYSTSSWLKSIGYAGQQSFVLSGTLSENISFTTNKMINLEQMEVAQQLTDFSSFTETLPGGLGTVIGEGGLDLSGGQRQRLAIARAVYRNPDMYVFDEATSNLDHYSENKILSQIKANCRKDQKTLVMVAHKLSLVSDADTIFVMEDGYLRESGSHQELMSLDNGSYRNLFERASLEVQKI